MRHGKKFNHLGRQTAHRKAMLANMACSLIEHKRINTTVAKAKALKQFVEPKIGDRPGGYTRIIKLGNRLGDNADMAMIELVDYNELYNAGKAEKKTTRRSRRGGSKAAVTPPVETKASNEEE